MPEEKRTELVTMENISKRFYSVQALKGVTFSVYEGEVVALVGENGAGKSTLMKMLSGIYHPDEGEIRIRGQKVNITEPRVAQQLGISTIFQEPSLAPHLNAIENIFLGREIVGSGVHLLKEREMRKEVEELYSQFFDTVEDIEIPTGDLGALKNRVIEIVKALFVDCSLVIMDEPTAALAEHEREILFRFVHKLKAQGVSVIYISHHLKELFGLVDRIIVMRDGEKVSEVLPEETDVDDLVARMVGREITNYVVKENVSLGEEVLRVEGLSRRGVLENISLKVHKGEIVGLAGLAGAGRTETVRAIVGADRVDSGQITMNGKPCKIRSPKDAIKYGIALLPENRKLQGAVLDMSVRDNITLANLRHILKGGFLLQGSRENETAQEYVEQLGVKTPSVMQTVKSLSGGNQQKVILAKWLFTKPNLLIFDEPTVGIDIGAKHEIYRLIAQFVKNGGSILLVSSELPELLGLSDRIYVMHQGKIVHEFDRCDATEEKITRYASGGND